MMRIALISDHASPLSWLGGVDCGGQNVYVGQMARHLAARGHQVDVFTRCDRPDLPRQARLAANVRVIHVPAGPPVQIRKEELLPCMDEFSQFVCNFAGSRATYDIVHANFFMSALVASDLRRAHGTPYVVTFHALGRVRKLHQQPDGDFPEERLDIEDAVVQEADRIIAECPQDYRDLVELYGADPQRLSVIPCGFDPAEFWPVHRIAARSQLGWPIDEPVILQLGRIVPRKGIETVIEAIAELRNRHHQRCRLYVVGGETREPDPRMTPEIGRLKSICHQLCVSDQVTFVGNRNRSELRNYYSAADVFVTVPWYEPFGITPLEAMACSVPVVGSAVGGIKMTVDDGRTGFLVPPRDASALADRLARLFAAPQLRQEMGAEGFCRAHRHFTWEKVTRAMEQLYAQVAQLTWGMSYAS